MSSVLVSTTSSNSNMLESTTVSPEEKDLGSLNIIIPFAVFLGILVLSALVYLMTRNRRKLSHIYCKRKVKRNLLLNDDNITDNEIDDPTKWLLAGKLHINQQNYQT
ncbi:uncharacterized protein LOC119679300 [Teleopsis dalmanni]|uniref:uncharacterized protein LOC119679300 n=1 Tax=Teleopsis dalmanni TaxID=139649 RepID=UPI0018CC9A02|nr:uncharacterized protein LOC119679300 [Teleopsis dalmanni]